jgi:epsilon-lactone hydrolase
MTTGRGMTTGRRLTAGRAGRAPRVPAAVVRAGVGTLGRRCLDPSVPWPVQRARLDQISRPGVLPRGTTLTRRTLAGVPAEVVTARASGSGRMPGSGRTVVHFHGGGYCVGSAITPRAWAANLAARAGCQVVLPEYRLAPEHPRPAALEDAQAVIAALSCQAKLDSVVLSGDSAGAGLALALAASLRDGGAELPAGCILISPWLDLGRDRRAIPALVRSDVLLSPGWLDACARAYAGPDAWADPSVSPLHAAHRGLPPLLIQAGTDELLAPDAALLAASAAAAGVDVTYTRWPRMWHDFPLQAGLLAAADSAVAQAAWFTGRVAATS